ncbi:MAG: serine/threonine protein kinase [Deltaproteobacteria bacterium]|nr:MAG: serine/threonine protein kinase [Deltaproteobacteria bacterium]
MATGDRTRGPVDGPRASRPGNAQASSPGIHGGGTHTGAGSRSTTGRSTAAAGTGSGPPEPASPAPAVWRPSSASPARVTTKERADNAMNRTGRSIGRRYRDPGTPSGRWLSPRCPPPRCPSRSEGRPPAPKPLGPTLPATRQALPTHPPEERILLDPSEFPPRIGPYVTERLIGRGAMAAVYLCRDHQGDPVAVKWLDLCVPGAGDDDSALTPPLLRRYENEVRALLKVDHPGVVRYRDHGTWHDRPYLVMDFVEGGDLRVYTRKLAERPSAERYARCRTIGQSLCEAVGALHAAGLVHRDVKPSNVLIDPDGRAILTDLGVVKDLAEGDHTVAGLVVGTIAYAAPEQLEARPVDGRTDLYGVGATLYYVLTGRRPFHGKPGRPRGELVPPSRHDPEIPPDLEAVVLKLMAPRMEDRYRDAATAAAAFATPSPSHDAALAGRGRLVHRVAELLDRAESTGRSLVIHARGPLGSGLSWLAGVVRGAATRRGLVVVEPAPGEAARVAVTRARQRPPAVVFTTHPVEVPGDVDVEELTLQPLDVADVRRTVVSAAPLTDHPSAVAERLHRYSGGLPALLLPLLRTFTNGARLDLPDTCPLVPEVDRFLDGLELDDIEVLAAVGLLPRPATADEIERVARIPPEGPLAVLQDRGIVRETDGRWTVTAAMFAEAARARLPDPDGIIARARQLRSPPPSPSPSTSDERPEDLALRGHLAEALAAARHALATAQAQGDRVAEATAGIALGQVLLDVGLHQQAARTLANASALAKASQQADLRRRAHVLRARASLDGIIDRSPDSRSVAAAAIDRLEPLGRRPGRPDDPITPLLLATWSRAAACLGDVRSSNLIADRALSRIPCIPPADAARTCLELARSALWRGDEAALVAALACIPPVARGGLVDFEQKRLEARARNLPLPPVPEPLLAGLTDEERQALCSR